MYALHNCDSTTQNVSGIAVNCKLMCRVQLHSTFLLTPTIYTRNVRLCVTSMTIALSQRPNHITSYSGHVRATIPIRQSRKRSRAQWAFLLPPPKRPKELTATSFGIYLCDSCSLAFVLERLLCAPSLTHSLRPLQHALYIDIYRDIDVTWRFLCVPLSRVTSRGSSSHCTHHVRMSFLCLLKCTNIIKS